MTNKDAIPSDQFARVVEELRKLSVAIDEIEQGVRVSKGIHGIEARACLVRASDRLQESGFWIGQALKHAQRAE